MSFTEKIRIMIVDDHPLLREGLQAMLSQDRSIGEVSTADSIAEVEAQCQKFQPAVVLLDVRMPNVDGFQVLQDIRKCWPKIRVIMLSSSATPAEVMLARRNGASGYLSKSTASKALLEAIFTVHAGGECFQAEVPAIASDLPALTSRELEVLRHLGRGLSNEDIGRVMDVSAETIKSHLKAVFGKLDVANRAEAVTRAYELGLLSSQ